MSNSNAISMDFNNDLNRIVVDYWNKVDDKNLKIKVDKNYFKIKIDSQSDIENILNYFKNI